MKSGFLLVGGGLIILALVIGCRGTKESEKYAGPVLAKVNDRIITPEDFVITMRLLYFPSERPKYTTPEGRRNFLNLLTAMELFYQEGKRMGLDRDPYIERVVENFRRYLIYHTLITKDITREAIINYFQRNFIHVAIIKMAKPDEADDATVSRLKSKATKLLDKLKAGADFAEMAKKYSDHPTGRNGGDPGPITFTKDWPVEVLRAAGRLKEVGELSPVIEAGDGFYILKLVEPYGKLNIAGLTDDREQFIYNVLLKRNFKTYATQLQLMADVELHPEALQDIKIGPSLELGSGSVPTLPPPGVPAVRPAATGEATVP